MAHILIDGENFKGKIKVVFKQAGLERPVWHTYDFKSLLAKVLTGLEVESVQFYFAKIKEHQDSKEKSRQLIEEQRLLKSSLESQGFTVVLAGRVRGLAETNSRGQQTLTFQEKGVDVRIAVDMMRMACDGIAKTVVLGSSDSDLQPAVRELRVRKVECVYLGFETQPNKGLTYTTNRTILIRNAEVLEASGQRMLEQLPSA